MKQPLMVVPPAQSEILYDAVLEDEQASANKRPGLHFSLNDDWDDREVADIQDRRLIKTRSITGRTTSGGAAFFRGAINRDKH